MKNILYITYDWLPGGSVGVIRTARFVKYLARRGYNVTVMSGHRNGHASILWDLDEPVLNDIKVIKVKNERNYYGIDRLIDEFCPQFEWAFYNDAVSGLRQLIWGTDFDCVISSSPPEGVHAIAAALRKLRHKPWIADLRDLWADDHYRGYNLIQKICVSNVEKRVLRQADKIITVSGSWAKELERKYPGRVSVVTNGFDEDYSVAGNQIGSKFIISYMGKLNGRFQDAKELFSAIKDLCLENKVDRKNFHVNFYVSGYGKPDISELSSEFGISDVVSEYPPVSLSRSLEIMRESSMLLIVGWNGRSSAGWRPQKAYEYLGSGVPILVVNSGANTELNDFLSQTVVSRIAHTKTDIKDAILLSYREFMEGRLEIVKPGPSLKEYTISNITGKLCAIIESIT